MNNKDNRIIPPNTSKWPEIDQIDEDNEAKSIRDCKKYMKGQTYDTK